MKKKIMIPRDRTLLLKNIFEDSDEFLQNWKESGFFEEELIKDANIKKIYALLYAKFGNSAVACSDINQFKAKVFDIVYEYAPTWEKKLEVQKNLRKLNEEELTLGAKSINNLVYNPSTVPSTDTTEEIPTVNQQNVNKIRRAKLEAYSNLVELLDDDVTRTFIDKFRNLFALFVDTKPLLYVDCDEDEDEEDEEEDL